MPSMFTVRWPVLARLEAFALFPVSMLLIGDVTRVQTFVDDRLVPVLSPYGAQLGVPRYEVLWCAVGMVTIIPYFLTLLLTDRFLTIRKGYAILSLAAIAVWAGAAMHLSDQLGALLPDRVMDAAAQWPFDNLAATAAGGLALLLHMRPLWTGMLDQGEVAERLLYARQSSAYREDEARHAHDVYYRQTADFRDWQRADQYDGLSGAPRESSAVKFITAITWGGVAVAACFAYFHWNNFGAMQPLGYDQRPSPTVAAGPIAVPTSTIKVPLNPAASPEIRVVATAPALPTVQRPGEATSGLTGPSVYAGPNMAVADRGPDGGFSFDAMVNGSRVSMMFDTGASVVAIRGEDAERLGINTARLRYSAKVKTANGVAEVAPVVIETLTIGTITQRRVAGFVAKPGMLQENLLGQTFLARLAKYNVEDNRLVLTGR